MKLLWQEYLRDAGWLWVFMLLIMILFSEITLSHLPHQFQDQNVISLGVLQLLLVASQLQRYDHFLS